MKYFITQLFLFLSILTGQVYSMESKITIKDLTENIQNAVNNKDHTLATQWVHRLELIVSADWSLLDSDQKEKYQELSSKILDDLEGIKPQGSKRATFFDQFIKETELKQKEAAYLIQALENDQCSFNIEDILGESKKSLPSPEDLKKSRINALMQIGSVKTMGHV